MTTAPAFTCCNCGTTDATEWTNLHDGRWVCWGCWWPVGRPPATDETRSQDGVAPMGFSAASGKIVPSVSDPPEPYLAVRLDGRSNRDRSSAMSHSRPESATQCTQATDLAGSHAERMAACPCPYCDVEAVVHHG